jgi:dephospho-CoA kinase
MTVIGLTGSIAMGKSEVASILVGEGLPVFDADREVHRLYDSAEGAALIRPLAPLATNDSSVDRKKLSEHLMSKPADLASIEKLVHAEVARRRLAFLEACASNGHALVVVDVPLLFETSGEKDVDVTVVVSAPEQMQRDRALARPGMTVEKLDMIQSRQMPDLEKRRRADYVIENNGSLDDLRQRTLVVLDQIKGRTKPYA